MTEPTNNFNISLENVSEIPVNILVVLGKATMTISQLMKLGRGAVIELDRYIGEAIDIFVNGKLVAKGEIVIVEEKIGITLTEILKINDENKLSVEQ
jgi:flagellar motor switch protein FliN/FliY